MWDKTRPLFDDAPHYKRLIGKLNHHTATYPYVTYAIKLVSMFMHRQRELLWRATLHTLLYIKKAKCLYETWPYEDYAYPDLGYTYYDL